MDKKIETFEVELKDFNTGELHKFTCLLVLTKLGCFVGVAPQSLEDAIQEYIENERYSYNDAVTSIDARYGYVLYDYEKNTKNLIPKHNYNGILNTEEKNCKECKNCERYVEHNLYDTVNLFEAIEQRKGMQAKDEQ